MGSRQRGSIFNAESLGWYAGGRWGIWCCTFRANSIRTPTSDENCSGKFEKKTHFSLSSAWKTKIYAIIREVTLKSILIPIYPYKSMVNRGYNHPAMLLFSILHWRSVSHNHLRFVSFGFVFLNWYFNQILKVLNW